MIKIKVYNKIDQIKSIWKNIYCGSDDLTLYQSYEWNRNIENYYKTNLYTFKTFHLKYFVYFKDNVPLIIAPLAIPRKSNLYIQLLGQYSKSGALNFIYSKNVEYSDFEFLIKHIKNKYKNKEIRFYEIGDYTKFGDFLKNNENAEIISQRQCIRSKLDLDIENYYDSLSKSTRQTIRTSYNRLATDNKCGRIEIIYGCESLESFKNSELNELYCKRNCEKNHTESITDIPNTEKSNKLLEVVKPLVHAFFPATDPFSTFATNNGFVLVKYFIDGKLSAYFIALLNDAGYCIVPTLFYDSSFKRYSPGLLMVYEFICDAIKTQKVKVFDLSRGAETYKLRYLPYPEVYLNNDYRIN